MEKNEDYEGYGESLADILEDAAYAVCMALNGEIGKRHGYEAAGRVMGVSAYLRSLDKQPPTC